MVVDVAGVAGAIAEVGEGVVDADRICAFSVAVMMKPLTPVV
jgi:hypothetical protein